MRLIPLAVAAILAASLPAQNLLTATGWKHDGLTDFVAKGDTVTFAPLSPQRRTFRLWQDVRIPATGTWLLRFQGWGGSKSYPSYGLTLGGESRSGLSADFGYQFVNLAADRRMGDVLRFEMTTDSTDFRPDMWWLTVELVPVVRPLPLFHTQGGSVNLTGDPAQVVAVSMRLGPPCVLPGYSGWLNLDTTAGLTPLFFSPGRAATPYATFYMGWLRDDVTFWAQSLDMTGFGSPVPVRYMGQ